MHTLAFHITRKTVILVLEGVMLMVVLVVAASSFMLWKASQGPIDLTFAREYILFSIKGVGSDLDIDANRLVLSWPRYNDPLVLNAQGVDVRRGNTVLLAFDSLDVRLAKAPLLLGLVRPITVTLDDLSIRLIRHESGALSMGLIDEAGAASAALSPPRDLNAPAFLATDGPFFSILSILQNFTIERLRVQIEDRARQESLSLDPIQLTIESRGDATQLSVRMPEGGDLESGMLALTLTPAGAGTDWVWEGQITDLDPSPFLKALGNPALLSPTFRLNGSTQGVIAADGTLKALNAALTIPRADIMWPAWQPAPLLLTDVDLAVSYAPDEKRLTLTRGSFRLGDLGINTNGSMMWHQDGTLELETELGVQSFALAQLRAVWPAFLDGEGITHWIKDRLQSGTIDDLTGRVRVLFDPATGGVDLVDDPVASLTFRDAVVDYRNPLPPVRAASGTAQYENDTMRVTIDAGMLDTLVIDKGATITVDHLSKSGAGEAIINGTLRGPFASLIAYLRTEPLRLAGRDNLDPKGLRGTGTYTMSVRFPTLKELPADKVTVVAEASLTDLLLPRVLNSWDVTGGPFTGRFQDGTLTFAGRGAINNQPVTLEFSQVLATTAMTLKASTTLSDVMRRDLGITLDEVQGPVAVDVDYKDAGDGTATASVRADGTGARIVIDAMNVEKVPGQPLTATMIVNLEDENVKTITDLDVNSAPLKLNDALLRFATTNGITHLISGDLPNTLVGETRVNAKFTHDPTRLLAITADGPQIDIRPFLRTRPPAADPLPYGLSVKARAPILIGANSVMVRNGVIDVTLDRAQDATAFTMTGTIGSGDFSARLMPDESGSLSLDVKAADAGAMLAALDIYKDVSGGTLQLTGQPYDATDKKSVRGTLVMDRFRVVRAPLLARLIGVMGLTGIGQLLGNEGLAFERLESDFSWRRQQGQDAFVFRDGRTSGNSLGLTFEGIVDRKKQVMNVEGTIVPVSEINTLIGNIPLLGDLLTGGGGGLIAATYTIKGPVDDARTAINPLSVLTPGFLRKLLFEGTVNTREPQSAPRTAGSAGNP